jgi:hypothetical protein
MSAMGATLAPLVADDPRGRPAAGRLLRRLALRLAARLLALPELALQSGRKRRPAAAAGCRAI